MLVVNFLGENLSDADMSQAALGAPIDLWFYNAGPVPIVKGDAVAIIPSDNAKGYMLSAEQLDVSDARPQYTVGGALEAAAVGAYFRARVKGVQVGANVVTAAVQAGLTAHATVDGRLDVIASADRTPVAINLEVAAANLSTVYWTNQLNLGLG